MAGPWEEYQQRPPWEEYRTEKPKPSLAGTMGEGMEGGLGSLSFENTKKSVSEASDIAAGTVFPAINEFIANVVGLPVDAVNAVLRMAGVGLDKPFGGGQTNKAGMESVGIRATPDVSTPGRQAIADIATGIASGVPFGPGGMAVGALSGVGAAAGRAADKEIGGSGEIGAAVGGIGAGLAPSALKAVGKFAAPQYPDEVAMMTKGGVKPTTAQIRGGEFQRAEQGAKSMPVVGTTVTSRLDDAADSFVTGTINRALEPIGEKLSPGLRGNEAVDELITATSNAYDDLLPQLKIVKDPGLDDAVISAITNNLPGKGRVMRDAREEFSDIVNNRLIEKFDNLGTMSGAKFKEADSILGRLARQYSRADDPTKQSVGDALKEVQIGLRNMVSRANPDLAPQLDRINEAYAMQLRIERAAYAARHDGGRFTPGQFQAAVTAPSMATMRESARGKARMQDWARAAERVMGPKYPDSGTPFRSALMGIAARPLAGASAVAGAFGLDAGLNAALRGATHLTRIRPQPGVPALQGAAVFGGQN